MVLPIRVSLQSLAVASLLSISACASQAEHEGDTVTTVEKLERLGYRQGDAVKSVVHSMVDNWIYVDDRNILIETGQSPKYLFEFSERCYRLSPASPLAFTTTVGSVTTFDKILVEDGGWQSQCLIKQIYKLEQLGWGRYAPPPTARLQGASEACALTP